MAFRCFTRRPRVGSNCPTCLVWVPTFALRCLCGAPNPIHVTENLASNLASGQRGNKIFVPVRRAAKNRTLAGEKYLGVLARLDGDKPA